MLRKPKAIRPAVLIILFVASVRGVGDAVSMKHASVIPAGLDFTGGAVLSGIMQKIGRLQWM